MIVRRIKLNCLVIFGDQINIDILVDHKSKTSLKLLMSSVRERPCRSSSRRFNILFSWFVLSIS